MSEDTLLNYNTKLEIDTTPNSETPTWAIIGNGFTNLTDSLNEVLYQSSYLIDKGWGSTEVTGGQFTTTLTGVRKYGDLAQDYIFSDAVMYNFGSARKTKLRVTKNGKMVEWNVALANITEGGGDSQQPNAITVTIHGNGAPVLVNALGELTVVSVAGTTSGNTAIYVNPVLEDGNSYKYKMGPSVDLPLYDEVLTTGWTAWDGVSEITATTGNEIVIAEVETATDKAKKAGKAIVTSL